MTTDDNICKEGIEGEGKGGRRRGSRFGEIDREDCKKIENRKCQRVAKEFSIPFHLLSNGREEGSERKGHQDSAKYIHELRKRGRRIHKAVRRGRDSLIVIISQLRRVVAFVEASDEREGTT